MTGSGQQTPEFYSCTVGADRLNAYTLLVCVDPGEAVEISQFPYGNSRDCARLYVRAGSPAVGLLDHLPGWECVYADTFAAVHRKQTP